MNLSDFLPVLSNFPKTKVVTTDSYTFLPEDFDTVIYFSTPANILTLTISDLLTYNFSCSFFIVEAIDIILVTSLTLYPAKTNLKSKQSLYDLQKVYEAVFISQSIEERSFNSLSLNFQSLETTDDLPEGTTNLYYTDLRASSYLSTIKGEIETALNSMETDLYTSTIPSQIIKAINLLNELKNINNSNILGVPLVATEQPILSFLAIKDLADPTEVKIFDSLSVEKATLDAVKVGDYFEVDVTSALNALNLQEVYKLQIDTNNFFHFAYILFSPSGGGSGGSGGSTPTCNFSSNLNSFILNELNPYLKVSVDYLFGFDINSVVAPTINEYPTVQGVISNDVIQDFRTYSYYNIITYDFSAIIASLPTNQVLALSFDYAAQSNDWFVGPVTVIHCPTYAYTCDITSPFGLSGETLFPNSLQVMDSDNFNLTIDIDSVNGFYRFDFWWQGVTNVNPSSSDVNLTAVVSETSIDLRPFYQYMQIGSLNKVKYNRNGEDVFTYYRYCPSFVNPPNTGGGGGYGLTMTVTTTAVTIPAQSPYTVTINGEYTSQVATNYLTFTFDGTGYPVTIVTPATINSVGYWSAEVNLENVSPGSYAVTTLISSGVERVYRADQAIVVGGSTPTGNYVSISVNASPYSFYPGEPLVSFDGTFDTAEPNPSGTNTHLTINDPSTSGAVYLSGPNYTAKTWSYQTDYYKLQSVGTYTRTVAITDVSSSENDSVDVTINILAPVYGIDITSINQSNISGTYTSNNSNFDIYIKIDAIFGITLIPVMPWQPVQINTGNNTWSFVTGITNASGELRAYVRIFSKNHFNSLYNEAIDDYFWT